VVELYQYHSAVPVVKLRVNQSVRPSTVIIVEQNLFLSMLGLTIGFTQFHCIAKHCTAGKIL